MKRVANNLTIVISLLWIVATAMLYFQHRHTLDSLSYCSAPRLYIATLRPAGLYLGISFNSDAPAGWDSKRIKDYSDTGFFSESPRLAGFFIGHFNFTTGPRGAGSYPTDPMHFVILPFWFLIFLPTALLIPLLRRRKRITPRVGFCKACGYDLRATPARCPECGATP